jgi:hypothetical protein
MAMTGGFATREELTRLAAVRAAGWPGIIRLGSLATAVSTQREIYRDAVLALFRTEAGEHDGVEANEIEASLAVFEAGDEEGVFAPAPPDGMEASAAGGGGRWIIATEALTAHLFTATPIELFLALRGRPANDGAFRVHLSVVLHRALFLLDRMFLHAAGVRCADVCWVLAGDKGSGKSTLSLALGAAGATVLADDHMVVRRQGHLFLTSGCDAHARLLEDAERHLFASPVDARVVELGGLRKKEISIGRYFASDPYREHRLDRLAFSRVGNRFEARPMRRRDALVELMRATRASHRFSGEADYAAYLDYLTALVESVESFSLELSPRLADLDKAVAWVSNGTA